MNDRKRRWKRRRMSRRGVRAAGASTNAGIFPHIIIRHLMASEAGVSGLSAALGHQPKHIKRTKEQMQRQTDIETEM